MKRKFLTALTAVCIGLLGLCSCDIGLKDKTYVPTEDKYFEFVLVGDAYEIAAKDGETLPSVVKLPVEYGGKKVVAVADEGFKSDSNVKEVVVPVGYERIGEEAFANCGKLAEVSIGLLPSTEVKTDVVIGVSAFAECSSLAVVEFGDGVKEIEMYAFKNSAITSLTLAKLEKLGDCAFENCKALLSAKLPSSLTEIGKTPFKGCSAALKNAIKFNGDGAALDKLKAGL